jgi:uncharacterized protein (TIGR02145 family)
MKKGIFTTIITTIAMFCAAQNGTMKNDTTRVPAVMAATCGSATVADADGNIYNTVLIGDQCWMAENLRVGTMIPGTTNQTNNGIIEKHCYNDNPANCITYGGLYQWDELMLGGAQAICPDGWHVPSDSEWYWLTLLLYGDTGGKLKATGTLENLNGLWYAPNTGATNSSGFNALPAGWKDAAGNYGMMGYQASFFTTTTWWYTHAYFRQLYYDNTSVSSGSFTGNAFSLSVRCLKNSTTAALPTVTTSPVTDITANTASGGGNVTADGGASVTARGVVWSTTSTPTVTSNQGITSNGNGTGIFTSELTGLEPNTIYYVKAYATNSEGTAYGSAVQFRSGVPVNLSLTGITIGSGTANCYDASQTISVSSFIVQSGGSATFIAGQNIRLLQGTKVVNNGYLHASITTTQSYCLQPLSMLQAGSETSATGFQTAEMQDVSPFFSVFPNPTTGKFTLELRDLDAMEAIHVEVCSMMGERVLQASLKGSQQYGFDLTDLPKGIYLIRLMAGDKMSVVKLIRK